MSADGTVRGRWAVYGLLGLELAVVVVSAATYNALDFRIYMWGGHAVLAVAVMLGQTERDGTPFRTRWRRAARGPGR